MKAHNLDAIGYLKLHYTPTDPDHAVRLRDLGSTSAAGQPVFVTDVTPQGAGNVGNKQYADTIPSNRVLTECISDTNALRIHFLAEAGSSYNPTITVDGLAVDLIEESSNDVRLFVGYKDITLSATGDVLVESSTGASFVVHIILNTEGPELQSIQIDSIPVGQTTVKQGDLLQVSGIVANEAVSLYFPDINAASGEDSISLGTIDSASPGYRTFSGSVIVSNRVGVLNVKAHAVNQLGTLGDQIGTTETVTLDQTYPNISINSVSIDSGRSALGYGDTATVNLSINGQDTQLFEFAYGDEGGSIVQYMTTRTITVTEAVISSSGGITVTATRAANGAVTTKTANVNIISIVPKGEVTVNGAPTTVVAGGSAGDIPEYPRLGTATVNLTTDTLINNNTSELASTGNQVITVNCAADEFGFLVYPSLLGTATFVDTSTSLVGGWDGATWPDDGTIGTTYGPATITRNGEQYYVYRTDFVGTSTQFSVTFQNPNLTVGTGIGNITVHLLRSGTPATENQVYFTMDQKQLEVRDNGVNTPIPHTNPLPVGSWKAYSLGVEVTAYITKGILLISDADAEGNRDSIFTIDGIVMQNEGGMQASVHPMYFKIVGFNLREISFDPFAQMMPIGTVVTTPSKLVVHYSGVTNPLTYRTDKTNVAGAFTVVDSAGNIVTGSGGTHIWLNDVAFTQSNTSGALTITIEETI